MMEPFNEVYHSWLFASAARVTKCELTQVEQTCETNPDTVRVRLSRNYEEGCIFRKEAS